MTPPVRDQWKTENEFFFASCGMCLGLSNVWRFPYNAYLNGGLVYIMVYVLVMVVIVVPMVYLEIFLGHFSSLTIPRAFGGFPMAKGVGWVMLYVNMATCAFYAATVVHCVFYLYYSFSSTLPWTSCKNEWNDANCYVRDYRNVPCVGINATLARKYASTNYTEKDAVAVSDARTGSTVLVPATEYGTMHRTCLNASQTATEQFLLKKVLRLSSGIEEIGRLQLDTLFLLSLCWFAAFLTIIKGIRSYVKVAVCTSCTSAALLLMLCISSLALRGSLRGLTAYLYPVWEKFVDIKTWQTASQQLCFSMGLAMGTLTCYGSHKPFEWPPSRNVLKLVWADFCFSQVAGFMAFALHGHAKILYGMELDDVATTGYEYAFVSFPESVKDLNNSQLWCIPFYLLLSMLAFNGVVAFLVAGLSAFEDSFVSIRGRRSCFAMATCAALFLFSLPVATDGGMYIVNLIDAAVFLNVVPWIALAEVILIIQGYGVLTKWPNGSVEEECSLKDVFNGPVSPSSATGVHRLSRDIRFMTGQPPDAYLIVCWRFVCPIALLVLSLGSGNRDAIQLFNYSYPSWTGIVEMAVVCGGMVAVMAQIMHAFAENRNDIYAAMEPEVNYGPADPEILQRYQDYLVTGNVFPFMAFKRKRRGTRSSVSIVLPTEGTSTGH